MYTIVDLETTGFSPSRGDKIIEIAAVKVNEKSNIVDQFCSLVNPMRDISNYHIHGIEPHLVKDAPEFSEVAPFLKSFLGGSTIVAHNANFDLRFLNYQLFNKTACGICTVKLSDRWTRLYQIENLIHFVIILISKLKPVTKHCLMP